MQDIIQQEKCHCEEGAARRGNPPRISTNSEEIATPACALVRNDIQLFQIVHFLIRQIPPFSQGQIP